MKTELWHINSTKPKTLLYEKNSSEFLIRNLVLKYIFFKTCILKKAFSLFCINKISNEGSQNIANIIHIQK